MFLAEYDGEIFEMPDPAGRTDAVTETATCMLVDRRGCRDLVDLGEPPNPVLLPRDPSASLVVSRQIVRKQDLPRVFSAIFLGGYRVVKF